MVTGRRPPKQLVRGFTLLAVLFAMLLLALATQGVMFVLSQQAQREREERLLRTGTEIAKAIGRYYESSPGTVKVYPRDLAELVEDPRFVTIRRHLRRLLPDPMTGSTNWGLVTRADGGIEGVYTVSESPPIRTAPLQSGNLILPAAARYSDWKFVYAPIDASSQNREPK
jgi:type II secretory pathway pseudopilin PulG